VVLADPSSPDWASALTAIGTIALAIMTVGAVITTIVITVQDRRHAETRTRGDRRHEQEREQLARAYAIDLASKPVSGAQAGVLPIESDATVYAVKVTNSSDRPI
jgi:hypothetical protein